MKRIIKYDEDGRIQVADDIQEPIRAGDELWLETEEGPKKAGLVLKPEIICREPVVKIQK